MMSEISDFTQVVVAIIGAVVALGVPWIAYQQQKMRKTGEATHTLVNSNFGIQLRVGWLALKRVAELTNDPTDIEAALLAEKLYSEHESKQAIVDKEK